RYHRLNDIDHRSRIDVLQPDHPGDVFVTFAHARLLRIGERGRIADLARGHDFYDRPRLDSRESFDLQDRLEDRVGLRRRDLGRRDQGDLAPDAFVDDEVLAGYLADEFAQDGYIDILEVHRDQVLGGTAGLRLGGHQITRAG